MSSVVDEAELLERLGGRWDLLREVAELFISGSPTLMADIRAAIRARDPQLLFATAHKMKGAVSNFSARPAMEAASHLERMGMEGSMERAQEGYDALDLEIERVREALASLIASKGKS